ncbi:XRE family transcriptional regulator [Streptomyces rimosus subsp. pseudoverticillatus]|uniref:helix-turn-helix domain-containing protein n=1 Tax=Streptomyces rimosus TaxID=1927 RepID=UPI0006B269B5|nr:helix-turn-helix transcriptional regulator [Streptomyces rimosus]KOT79648.1 XRE family transcriptional regulator [Streptomyces rimosus subsp. pseudoverticillatus]
MAMCVLEAQNLARDVLARELRRLREASGRSLAQLAEETNYDRTYLNRLENGERLSKRQVMEALDRTYGTKGLLVGLWRLAHQDVFTDKFELFMQYEAKAVIMHKYVVAFPGLLQTEAYARALLSSPPNVSADVLEQRLARRLARQELLCQDQPPDLRVIFDESALARPAADPNVWHEQLLHLVEATSAPRVTVQVLPFAAGGHDLMGGSLSLLWMADGRGVGYLEGCKAGGVVEDAEKFAEYRVSYDKVRDMALSPQASVAFMQELAARVAP